MRVTDEQVWAAVCAWRDVYDAEYMHSGSTMGNDEQAMRAALEAALSHAAGQEVEYPECTGDPADCPENEGHGCCKTCTCPSGDGSLLWPCPAHPPERGEATGDTTTFSDAWARLGPIDRAVITAYFERRWTAVARSEGEDYAPTCAQE